MSRALCLAVALIVTACAPFASDGPTAIDPDVGAVALRLIAAENARDADALVAEFTDDGMWLPAGNPAIEGKAALRGAFVELVSAFGIDLTADVAKAEATGDLAYASGTARGTMTPLAGGAPIPVDNRFLAYMRRVNGAWKVSHLTWHPRAEAN